MSEFDALDEYDKAMLIAYWRTFDKMEAIENQEAAEEAERKSKAK